MYWGWILSCWNSLPNIMIPMLVLPVVDWFWFHTHFVTIVYFFEFIKWMVEYTCKAQRVSVHRRFLNYICIINRTVGSALSQWLLCYIYLYLDYTFFYFVSILIDSLNYNVAELSSLGFQCSSSFHFISTFKKLLILYLKHA